MEGQPLPPHKSMTHPSACCEPTGLERMRRGVEKRACCWRSRCRAPASSGAHSARPPPLETLKQKLWNQTAARPGADRKHRHKAGWSEPGHAESTAALCPLPFGPPPCLDSKSHSHCPTPHRPEALLWKSQRAPETSLQMGHLWVWLSTWSRCHEAPISKPHPTVLPITPKCKRWAHITGYSGKVSNTKPKQTNQTAHTMWPHLCKMYKSQQIPTCSPRLPQSGGSMMTFQKRTSINRVIIFPQDPGLFLLPAASSLAAIWQYLFSFTPPYRRLKLTSKDNEYVSTSGWKSESTHPLHPSKGLRHLWNTNSDIWPQMTRLEAMLLTTGRHVFKLAAVPTSGREPVN